jgi:stage IV sporulation protein FB
LRNAFGYLWISFDESQWIAVVSSNADTHILLVKSMRWSFQIATITGIQIRLHLTFLLLLAWVGFGGGVDDGWRAALTGIGVVLLVFACVLLHELGHAWAARRYGIRTPDITLLPIGGIARLERIPERPREEMVVALAGPLVSAGLALLFGLVSGFTLPPLDGEIREWGELWSKLFTINSGLLLFNLLPVFPMDGGRVFRALLALRFDYRRSTRIAATLGQGLAVVLGLAGLWLPAPLLVFIAVFLFLSAGSEASQVELREASRGLRVADVMITKFSLLPHTAQLADAADLLLQASQHSFPLMDGDGRLVGLLTRNSLIGGLNQAGPLGAALSYANTGLPALEPAQHLAQACALMQQFETSVLPVMDVHGRLVGLFTAENLGELMLLEHHSPGAVFKHPKNPGV